MLNNIEFENMVKSNHKEGTQYTIDELIKNSYQIYCNEIIDKNAEIDKLNKEIEELKLATVNATCRKRATVKKGVKLTEKQILFIKEFTQKYKLSREQMLIIFNEQYPKRKEPLTMSQLRKIMTDNEIKKPKKCDR